MLIATEFGMCDKATKMEDNFAGAGRKRPQLNIPLSQLDLDNENPRITEDIESATQGDILQILYSGFDLLEVASSMVVNGYFDEEPIVVVPQNLPDEFFDITFDSLEDKQAYLQGLVADPSIRFTVVEGNRRTATAKLLIDSASRSKVRIKADFPSPSSQAIRDDLSIIPAIFYPNREEVSKYLGVRHIAGVLKWDAYAKARYIAKRIEETDKELPILERIKNIQSSIGDRSDSIKKQYIVYKVLHEAEDELSFQIQKVKARFSLLTLALGSPSIRQFIGVGSFKETNVAHSIVPAGKLSRLELLLTWIFGDGKGKSPILTDSRRISDRLAPVLENAEATDYLIRTGDLEQAYEQSDGERDYLVRSLSTAVVKLENALRLAYKYSDDGQIKDLSEQAFNAVLALQKTLK